MTLALTAAHAAALFAQAAPAGSSQPGGGPNFMIMMLLMFVVMYFILIRPQRKKQKETENLQKAIEAGDEVITIGGAHGVVTTVRENTLIVRVAEGKIEFDRSAIARKVPKAVEATVEK
jgi:preprotein translocase subunit YajC